jgi:pimeloyl-ACP methyl ester carboxylesterase
MEHIKIKDKADIVGLSAGGNIGIMLCNRVPERCRSLTLISTTMNNALDAATLRYRRENARTVVLEGKDTLFRRFNEYIVSPTASMHARARYRSMLETTPYETLVAFFNTETSPNPATENIRRALPIMIPVGSADSIVSEDIAQRYSLYFDQRQIITLDSAGRLLPLEAPQELNLALQTFWDGLN